MADYSWRTVETRTREYTLPSPTVGAQVKQVIAKMEDELGPDRAKWDDAIRVAAHDDEIVFTYDMGGRTVPEGEWAKLREAVTDAIATYESLPPAPGNSATAVAGVATSARSRACWPGWVNWRPGDDHARRPVRRHRRPD